MFFWTHEEEKEEEEEDEDLLFGLKMMTLIPDSD